MMSTVVIASKLPGAFREALAFSFLLSLNAYSYVRQTLHSSRSSNESVRDSASEELDPRVSASF